MQVHTKALVDPQVKLLTNMITKVKTEEFHPREMNREFNKTHSLFQGFSKRLKNRTNKFRLTKENLSRESQTFLLHHIEILNHL